MCAHVWVLPAVQFIISDRVGAVLMCLGGSAPWISNYAERAIKRHQLCPHSNFSWSQFLWSYGF